MLIFANECHKKNCRCKGVAPDNVEQAARFIMRCIENNVRFTFEFGKTMREVAEEAFKENSCQ